MKKKTPFRRLCRNGNAITYLDNSLVNHGIGYLHESGDIRAVYIIHKTIFLASVFHATFVNSPHDLTQPVVDFCPRPRLAHAVLRHLKTRHRDTSGIGSLAGTVENPGINELIHSIDS